jgi:hypothetical protein
MKPGFLQTYLDAFPSIQGFFTFDAALMFMAYNQLIRAEQIAGDVLEIGVHHGLSAIAIGALAAPGRRFVAVDLFDELQDHNESRSGAGNRAAFLQNMQRFFDDLAFVDVFAGHSSGLNPDELGSQFSFCHIDGGHSPEETYHDLELCSRILIPGGLVALDDYFNPSFPGVSEGAVRFHLEHREVLKPIAIGFNKVLFQKQPGATDLNRSFAATFKRYRAESAVLWGVPVNYFTSSFQPLVDVAHSTEQSIVVKEEAAVLASFSPHVSKLEAKPGESLKLPVTVENRSETPFPHGRATFGLSYHLLSHRGQVLKFDNLRTYFEAPLAPGSSSTIELNIHAPMDPGSYLLELDLVWELMWWAKEKGNPTCMVELMVQ